MCDSNTDPIGPQNQELHIPAGATATLDYSKKYQTIEGFGGGFSFGIYPYSHPRKAEIYDSLFNQARMNVIRVGNWYNPQEGIEVEETSLMVEIQQQWPQVKTMLTSWSPPPYLKSNNSVVGADETVTDTGTLLKKSDGTYMYQEYADYWLQSVQHFQASGMKIDWVSIQNEPDWPACHEGCVLEGKETPTIASYGKALDAVYASFQANLAQPIPLIGPDVAGVYEDRFSRFLNSPELDRNKLTAYCHHYYDHAGVEWMVLAGQSFSDKPIYQTEFLINENMQHGPNILTWIDHARFVHYMLTAEGVSMYLLFALTYKPASTHCCFSIDTLGGEWYEVRPAYFMLKHFSRFIRRGWQRMEAFTNDPRILISAYSDVNNDTTAVVMLNDGLEPFYVYFPLAGVLGRVFQTTDSLKFVSCAPMSDSVDILLPGRSLTTVEFRNPAAVSAFP